MKYSFGDSAIAAERLEIVADAFAPTTQSLLESLHADPSLAARTLVTSFHPEILLAVRRAMPTASTGRIFGRTPAISDVLMLTKEADAGTALCGIAGLTADGVAELQATGLEDTAWPVPHQAALVRAAALGVNGITTDNPHLLRRVA